MGKRKKKRTHVQHQPDSDPGFGRSFVFKRGEVGPAVPQLVEDMRNILSPHTYSRLRESKKNVLKDFLHVAPSLNVAHLLIFGQSSHGVNLRLLHVPRGPTLTFRLLSYSLASDVRKQQKKPHSPGKELKTPPLVVLTNFGQNKKDKDMEVSPSPGPPMRLLTAMLQSLFPAIDPSEQVLHKSGSGSCRRVVLFNYDKVRAALHVIRTYIHAYSHYFIHSSIIAAGWLIWTEG